MDFRIIMTKVKRITVSLKEKNYRQLEEIIKRGKWSNRSQVINHLINGEFTHSEITQNENVVMAGSLTLFYEDSQREIHDKVVQIQRQNIEEVISSNRLLLENGYVMEILVLQGSIKKLQHIKQKFVTIKGVEVADLALTSTILPPIKS